MPLSLESVLGQAAWLLADMRGHLAKQASWDYRAATLVEQCNDFFLETSSWLQTQVSGAKPSPEPVSAPIAGEYGVKWKAPSEKDGTPTEPNAPSMELEPSSPRDSFSPTECPSNSPDMKPLPTSKLGKTKSTLSVDFF